MPTRGAPLREGWLGKHGEGRFDGWQQRRFELWPARLDYFDESGALKGSLGLLGHSRLELGKAGRFELHGVRASNREATERIVRLEAHDSADRDGWAEAIRGAIAQHKAAGEEPVIEVAYRLGLVEHRLYHMVQYPNCVVAEQLVSALVEQQRAEGRLEAVAMCQELVRNDLLHHVCDDHPFEDGYLFYRFTADDTAEDRLSRGKLPAPFHRARDLPASTLQLEEELKAVAEHAELVEHRWYHLVPYFDCLVAEQLVSELVAAAKAASREEAVDMCQELVRADLLHHVCDDHPFEDGYLFYRFTSDLSDRERLNRRKQPPVLRVKELLDGIEELDCQEADPKVLQDILDQLKASADLPEPQSPSPEQPAPLARPMPSRAPAKPAGPDGGPLQLVRLVASDFRAWGLIGLVLCVLAARGLIITSLVLLLVLLAAIMAASSQQESLKRISKHRQEAPTEPAVPSRREDEMFASAVAPPEPTLPPAELPPKPVKPAIVKPVAGPVHRAQSLKCFVFGADGVASKVPVDANVDTQPVPITGPHFSGRMVVRVLGLQPTTRYFEGKSRKFSIQVQGRFTRAVCVEELEFGAVFDHPIDLPWGSSIMLALAHQIDPALREDLHGSKPWLMSPMFCGMNRIKVSRPADTSSLGKWSYGGRARLEEDSGLILPADVRAKAGGDFRKRRKFFDKKPNRQRVTLKPDQLLDLEFLSSMVDFTTFEVSLGIRKSVLPYLKGQPVRFEGRLNGKVLFGVVFDGSQLKL